MIAPIPEADTLAVSVPSIAASASPKHKLLGVVWREYKWQPSVFPSKVSAIVLAAIKV